MAEKERFLNHVSVGERFSRLTVVDPDAARTNANKRQALVHCDCGNDKLVIVTKLVNGRTQSCGCMRADNARALFTKNGYTAGTADPVLRRLYYVWMAIIGRTTHPRHTSYPKYGERGITICDRWLNSFEAFVEDMGPQPSLRHTVDRKDNNRGYEPDNCRWATKREQNINRRVTHMIERNGRRVSLIEECERVGVNHELVRSRLRAGWDLDRAFFSPAQVQNRSIAAS